MRPPLLVYLFLIFVSALISCDDRDREKAKEKRKQEDSFFKAAEPTVSLKSLQNELADGQTDFLRSFSNDQIPWQKWEPSLLNKAESAQRPIILLVGSSLSGQSRRLGKELSENPSLRELITRGAVCAVVDIHAFPEIGTLCYHLANEIKRTTVFPALLWLSHEGSPLTSLPIGETSGRELEVIVTNAVMTVEDIWTDFSEYAVENSRRDNEVRQLRLTPSTEEYEHKIERSEVFRRSTRQLSSLYSFGDRDLDYIGGLIPTNSLELLAIGSLSNLLTDQVRENCRKASLEVSLALIQEAIKDQLDHSYFFARQTTDWSLPSFSKNISSQANVAHMLIRIGSILDQQTLIQEGFSLLEIAKNDWLAKSLSSRSTSDNLEEPGRFFWDTPSLQEVLSEAEVALAVKAFSLEKEGNIPPEADPLNNYFELNTLRRRVPIQNLAKQFRKGNEEIESSLAHITQKLRDHREKNTSYETESSLSLGDLALILKAQIAKSVLDTNPNNLQPAFELANRLEKEYLDPEKGWARLPLERGFINARCSDYAFVSDSFLLLYQASLDKKWLTLSLSVIDEAIAKLKTDEGLLSEVPNEGRIIPLRQYNRAMIFGPSSLGVLDLSLNRAWAITGDKKYHEILKLHENDISPLAIRAPVNHTDFLASCALGSHPLVAVVKGNPNSPNTQEILTVLNSQKHLPFISIRRAKTSDRNLKEPDSAEGASVTLIRDGNILGTATTPSSLREALHEIISSS